MGLKELCGTILAAGYLGCAPVYKALPLEVKPGPLGKEIGSPLVMKLTESENDLYSSRLRSFTQECRFYVEDGKVSMKGTSTYLTEKQLKLSQRGYYDILRVSPSEMDSAETKARLKEFCLKDAEEELKKFKKGGLLRKL